MKATINHLISIHSTIIIAFTATALRGRIHAVRPVHVAHLSETVYETGPSTGRRSVAEPRTRAGGLAAGRGDASADRHVRHAGETTQIRRLRQTTAKLGRVGRHGQR